MSEPFPEFLRCMTQEDAPGSVVFISPTALNNYGNERIADHAPGTGPFKFARRFHTLYGSGVEIVRNDDYWDGPPHLDGIRFTPFPVPMTEHKRCSTAKWISPTGRSLRALRSYAKKASSSVKD